MKIFLSIFVLLLAGNPGFAQTPKASEIRIIILKDEGGFGVDKGFEISLERGDSATFHGGRNFYGRKGDYRGSLDEKQFAKLANLIVSRNFFALENRYEGSMTDVGTRTITVIYGGKQKSVVNSGAKAVKEFSAIENAIKQLEAKIKWRSNLKNADEQIESFFDLLAFNFDCAQARLCSVDYQMIL
jgi:hypothetical protein